MCGLVNAYWTMLLSGWNSSLGSTCKISEDGGYTFGALFSPVTAPHGPCVLQDGSLLYIGRRFSQDDSFDDGENRTLSVGR